jgi:hypothetical protein
MSAATHATAEGTSRYAQRFPQFGCAVVSYGAFSSAPSFDPTPESIAPRLPRLTRDAQREVQFARSTPGVSVAVAGMGCPQDALESLPIGVVPPLTPSQYQ